MLLMIKIDVYHTPKYLLKISKEESNGNISTKLNICIYLNIKLNNILFLKYFKRFLSLFTY